MHYCGEKRRENRQKVSKTLCANQKEAPIKGLKALPFGRAFCFAGNISVGSLIATESSLFVCYNWLVGRLFCIFNDSPMENDENNQKARRISHETKEKTC